MNNGAAQEVSKAREVAELSKKANELLTTVKQMKENN